MNIQAARSIAQEGAQLLPPAVREALREAARTATTQWDPLARERAINRVIERARAQYPEKFRTDGGADADHRRNQ